jgi:hypothetical protein
MIEAQPLAVKKMTAHNVIDRISGTGMAQCPREGKAFQSARRAAGE